MQIAQRPISDRQPPYIIAEIGVNHDGSPERALELVDLAADAGADAVKTQWFRADMLMSAASGLAAYQRDAGERDPRDMLRRLELDAPAMQRIVRRARERSLHAIVTVFSVELVGEAQRLGWDAYKTASPDIVHKPLIDRLVETGQPLILSTGASTIEEVSRAIEWLGAARSRAAVLQCVSSYPTHDEDAAMAGIGAIARVFDGPVGYSDHTTRVDAGACAVRAGACVLEKHLTYDRGARGPDHSASLDGAGFAQYVRLARASAPEAPAPHAEKRVLECERDVRRVSRQSIVARERIDPGTPITRALLTFKRPGTGLEPWRLPGVLGRTAARRIEADTPITEGDLS